MSKKKYMEILLEQIRNKKAKKLVEEEIGSHIDDQTAAYLREGYKETDAERRAVLDMGDPVDTGVSLDRIHRPRMSWKMFVLAAVISVAGILVQCGIWTSLWDDMGFLHRQLAAVILGFILMTGICFIDYSVIGRLGEILAVVFTAIVIAALLFFHMNCLPALSTSFYLSIPLFGILLYQARKKSRMRKLSAIVFWLLFVVIAMRVSYVLIAANLLLLGVLMLTFACGMGWIGKKKPFFLGIVWGTAVGIPLLLLFVSLRLANGRLLAAYQSDRLRMILAGTNMIPPYRFQTAAEVLSKAHLIGGSSAAAAAGFPDELASNYTLLHVGTAYGILPLLVIVFVFAVFCCQTFRMALGQKNQLGMAMGFGCSLVLSCQTVEYLLTNLGFIPNGLAFLPLFSYGAGNILLSFILLGILLSIHRYQNLATERTAGRRRIRVKISVE